MNFKRAARAALILLAFVLCGANLSSAAELTVTGVVRAEEEVVVRSEFSGIVQRIAVHEGDRVREGDVLVELRNDRQKITLDLSKAGLTKAQASLQETKVLLDNAEKELSRVRTAGDALPRKELEDKSDMVLRLQANLGAQTAELRQAETEVRMREHELRETQLLAPFAGTVTQININRGDTLRPLDTPVLELVALEQLYAEILVPSTYIQRIRVNQTLQVQVESEWMGRAGQLTGKVIYVNPKVDASSRTFKVKVRVPSMNGVVRPGMLALVRLEP